MSSHYNRLERVAVIFRRLDGLADDVFVRQMATYILQTYGEGADPETERIIDVIGYLTVNGGPYVAYLSATAYATLVGYAADAGDLPSNVALVRVEWPWQMPEGGWPAIEWEETDSEGNPVTCSLPVMS